MHLLPESSGRAQEACKLGVQALLLEQGDGPGSPSHTMLTAR